VSAVQPQISPHERAASAVRAEAILVIGRNASLGRRQAVALMLFMCGISFGIAGVFAVLGYWMILPFAGLEMLVLALGLAWSMRGNAWREVLRIDEDFISVERGLGGPRERYRFSRYWVQLRLEAGAMPNDHRRLMLSESGRHCEVGGCLTEDERIALAQRLRELLQRPVPAGIHAEQTLEK